MPEKKNDHENNKLSNYLNYLAAASALTAFLTGFFVLQSDDRASAIFGTKNTQTFASKKELFTLRQSILEMRVEQARLTKSLSDGSSSADTKLLATRLTTLESRQRRIEDAIMRDPARALEIPMIRRDIEAMRETNTQAIANLNGDVEQVYDLTKWLLGALAVGVFSLAISNFFSRKGS